MPRFRTFAPLTALALLLAAVPAGAWSNLGHRLVGELAERHLQPAARAEVQRLLAGESEPTLAGVASWADALRSSDPEAFRRTARWHYVKTEPGSCRVQADQCEDGQCVVGAIQAQRAILADRSRPLAERRDALKFVVHFVGDVHNPFHASSRDDKGGNDYQVSLRTPIKPEAYARNRYVDGVMGTNLHSVWDYYVLAAAGLEFPAYAERLAAAPWPPATTPASDPAGWAAESCRLIETRGLYPDGHKLDHRYLDAHRPLAEQRIRQAGYRLAQVLNQALAPR